MQYRFPMSTLVTVETDREEFARYATTYLGGFLQEEADRSSGELSVESSVLFDEATPWPPQGENTNILARHIRTCGSQGIARTAQAIVKFSFPQPDQLVQEIFPHRPNTGWKQHLMRFARQLAGTAQPPADQNHFYQKLLRHAAQLPVLASCLNRGCIVGHGFALKIGCTGVIVFGAGGIGKSTTGWGLMHALGEAEFLTDNYVVLSQSGIEPFPEPLRMENSLDLLPVCGWSDADFTVGNRDYYIPCRELSPNRRMRRLLVVRLERGPHPAFHQIPVARAVSDFVAGSLTLGMEFPFSTWLAFSGYIDGDSFVPQLNYAPPEGIALEGWRLCVPTCSTADQLINSLESLVRQVENDST